MRQKSGPEKQPAEDAIRDIRRATRRHFSAEENRPERVLIYVHMSSSLDIWTQIKL